jgi:hypothetical protein
MRRHPKGETTMRILTKVSARLIAAVLAVATVAPVAQAQNQLFAAQVNVPFAFETSSGQHFQPGVYTIRINGSQTMVIRSATSSGLAMIQSQAYEGRPAPQGKAVFTHYGDKYYLRSVSVAGSSTRLLFAKSKEERETQIANGKTPSAVELALLQAGR